MQRLHKIHFRLRLCLVLVKAFPENILFFENAIFRKGKYFHVFGCISKKFSKNIFWCLEKKKEEPKPRKTQTKPKKKKSSNLIKLREEGRERGDWVRRGARSHGGGEGEIGAVLREIAISAKARSRSTTWSFSLCAFARLFFLSLSFSLCASVSSLCASVSSLCASQFRKSFEVKIGTEMNFRVQSCFLRSNENDFQKILFSKPTKQPILRKMISWNHFHPKQTHP